MPDFYFDVDAALTEVPVNLMPLTDDTDFKTRETAIVYNSAGMDLVWNFVTSAGVMTQTAVTPTTAGVYDWVNQGDGLYSIEIPASGGVSINNDAEGYGWFSGLITGVLPWRGPTIGFRAAALNDALLDGGDLLDVNVTQVSGTAENLPTAAEVADAVWNEATTGHETAGTFGEQCKTDIDAILADTNELQVDDVPGLIAALNDIAATDIVSAGAITTLTGAVVNVDLVDTTTTNTDMRGTESALLAASAPTNFGDLAITATTGLITVGTNNDKTGYSISGTITTLDGLNNFNSATDTVANVTLVTTTTTNTDMVAEAPTATVNADALLNRDMSAVSDTNSRSPLNALRFLRNKWSITAGTLTVTEENDTTSAWTATVTTDAAADPITGNDPA